MKALPTMCTYYIIVNYFVIPDDLRTIFRLNEVNRQWSQTWKVGSGVTEVNRSVTGVTPSPKPQTLNPKP